MNIALRLTRIAAVLALTSLVVAGCTGGGRSAPTATPTTLTPSPPVSASPVPKVHIKVNGETVTVSEGSTSGAIAERLGIPLRSGNYVDVSGEVLEAHVYPAKIFVAGKRASRTTVVSKGQSLTLKPGRDHEEDTTNSTQNAPGEMPLNPQYNLATASGEFVIERGDDSNKIATVTFDKTGKAKVAKEVALTFDDGPNPPYTNKILKILHKHNVPATFFVVGYEVEKYPNLVRRELKQGMAIGDHSWSHPTGFASLDDRELTNQVGRTYEELTSLGVTPYLFRPPGGSFDSDVVETARRLGMRTVMWTTDTRDYESGRRAKDIVKFVLKNVHSGSIVLMHDGGGDQSATVNALPDIIKELRKRGYEFTSIPKAGWEPGPGASTAPTEKP